jgi:hypothetical protein
VTAVRHPVRAAVAAVAVTALAALCAGCGEDIQSPDLFRLTRTGQGATLTLLVNDAGTISCDGAKAKPLADASLIAARDLSEDLATDAGDKLTIPAGRRSVYYFRIKLQQGTVSFPDTAAGTRKVLSEAEVFATQAAQQDCGSAG